MPNNNHARRKKDSARLVWDSKPRPVSKPKDIESHIVEVVISHHPFRQSLLAHRTVKLRRAMIDD
jgi:hypothetical protein